MATAAPRAPGAEPVHRYLIAAAVSLASMLQVIDTSIVNVAIPHMMGSFGATVDEISWVSTGYIIASVIVIPLTGWLSDFFGRKNYFAGSILLFTLASFFCGTSHTLGTLVFWRIVQGIGGAALLSTSQAILFETFPREEAAKGMAFFGVAVMVGPTLGPTLGGWLTDNYSWPWIFFINLPLGLIAAGMIVAYVHDSPHQQRTRNVDAYGIALLAVSVGALQLMLERGERLDWWDSRLVVVLALLGVVAAGLLLWRELTIDKPAIDFRVLRHPQFSAGVILGILLGAGLFGSVFILPVFLQGMLRMTAWQTGKILLPGALASAFSMGMVGRIGNKVDGRLLITIGSALFGIAMWQLSHMTIESGTHDFFWPLILRGFGLGLVFVPLSNLTLADVDPRELGQASGLFNFFRQLGGSFSIALMASLLGRFTAQKHALLVEHVGLTDPNALARIGMIMRGLMARGIDAISAQREALALLDRQITAQASILAFGRIYLLSGAILVGALPLLLLFRSGRPGSSGQHLAAE